MAFDFFFVHAPIHLRGGGKPLYSHFGVMFLVALVISHLTSLIQRQAEAARLQERQTAAMHSLSRKWPVPEAWSKS